MYLSFDYRVYGLEMGWICKQRYVHLLSRSRRAIIRGAQVVFNITSAPAKIVGVISPSFYIEFVKQCFKRLADHIG